MTVEILQSNVLWVSLQVVFYAFCFMLGAAAIIGVLVITIISDKDVLADQHYLKESSKERNNPMIKIKYDGALVHAGGTVMQIHNNIKNRVKYEVGPITAGEAEISINIEGFSKELSFDLRFFQSYAIDVVVIKLDDSGEVSVEQMSEVSFNSQKHLEPA